MITSNCPHCGRAVNNKEKRIWCPHCERRLKTSEQMELDKLERIKILMDTGKQHIIEEFLKNGDKKNASREIMYTFKCDIVEALNVLDEIECSMAVRESMGGEHKTIRCYCGCSYPNNMDRCPNCSRQTVENQCESADEENVQITKPPKTPSHKTSNNPNLTPCSACNHQISKQAETCPNCGHPTGVHVCPKCRSVNTKVITGASKATSIFMWGVFAANKVVSKYECKDCGHRF